MNLLFDTNIILNIIRSGKHKEIIEFLNPDNRLIYVSVVSEAEIKSIATRSDWGMNRIKKLDAFLDTVVIVDINHQYINSYVEIDTYSQMCNPKYGHYGFSTPRNMGKNDLWIASLAGLLSLILVTTDNDFEHLDGVFFETRKISPKEFSQFY